MRSALFILSLFFSLAAFGCGDEVAAKATFDTGSGPQFPTPDMFRRPTNDLTHGGKAEGTLVVLKGRVTKLDGTPVENTVVILWQADRNGFYLQHILRMMPSQPYFGYIGIVRTNANGEYVFYTLRPPPYGPRSAHIHLATVKSDNTFLFTEVHFADDQTPDYGVDMSSPEARELIKTGTPTTARFGENEPMPATEIEFDIRVD